MTIGMFGRDPAEANPDFEVIILLLLKKGMIPKHDIILVPC
jgi:hypothetical protein